MYVPIYMYIHLCIHSPCSLSIPWLQPGVDTKETKSGWNSQKCPGWSESGRRRECTYQCPLLQGTFACFEFTSASLEPRLFLIQENPGCSEGGRRRECTYQCLLLQCTFAWFEITSLSLSAIYITTEWVMQERTNFWQIWSWHIWYCVCFLNTQITIQNQNCTDTWWGHERSCHCLSVSDLKISRLAN